MRPNLDFQTVLANIETFIELRNRRGQKLPLIRTSFLLNDLNASEMEMFREMWTKKVDYVSIQRYVPISIKKSDKLARAMPEAPVRGAQKCSYPWESLFVHGDGAVVPCAAHRSRFISVGNINRNTLHEIWHSPGMEELRDTLRTNRVHDAKLCGTCLLQ
jgi:radical SAM protein with 4Fe4S-binding SPASM domain